MIEAWREANDGDALVITFEGAGPYERSGRSSAASSRALAIGQSVWEFAASLPDGMHRLFFVVFGLAFGFGSVWLASVLGESFGLTFGRVASTTIFALGLTFATLLVPLSLSAIRKRRERPRRSKTPPPKETFTVRLDQAGLSVASDRGTRQRIELDAIGSFESGRRLAVRKVDGTREELCCALPFFNDHHALAARLDAAMRTLRAAEADYRGNPRVRVASSAPEELLPEDEDDSVNIQRRLRR